MLTEDFGNFDHMFSVILTQKYPSFFWTPIIEPRVNEECIAARGDCYSSFERRDNAKEHSYFSQSLNFEYNTVWNSDLLNAVILATFSSPSP